MVLKHWHNFGWNHVDVTQIYLWVSYYFSPVYEFQSMLARKFYGERIRTVSNKQALWQILLKYKPSHYSRGRGNCPLWLCLVHRISNCVCRTQSCRRCFRGLFTPVLWAGKNLIPRPKKNKLEIKDFWDVTIIPNIDTMLVRLWAFGEKLSCQVVARRV